MFGIGRIVHKTNTFARAHTNLSDFEEQELLVGSDVFESYDGTDTVLGGVIDRCRTRGVEIAPILAASASPGGIVASESLDKLVDQFLELFRGSSGVDGLILELSGAMVSTEHRAGDEYILRRVREHVSELPIAVILDFQANPTPTLVDEANVIIAPHSFPSTELAGVGSDAVDLLCDVVDGNLNVEMTIQRLPFLIPVAAQRADLAPMCDLIDETAKLDSTPGVVRAAILGGFPQSDVLHAGASALVLSERGAGDSQALAQQIANRVWDRRGEFFVRGHNAEEAIHEGMAARQGPVVITDLGDDPGLGGPGDGTTLLWGLLDLGARNAVLAAIVDAQAVDACVRAGPDAKIEIPLGGRRDTRHGFPIDVQGRVRTIADGRFKQEGPIETGRQTDAGRVVVLELESRHEGTIEVIVTERSVEVIDPGLFHHVGIEPSERKIVAVKSTARFLPAFASTAAQIYSVITPGITTPDPAFYDYRNVERPVFPLDAM